MFQTMSQLSYVMLFKPVISCCGGILSYCESVIMYNVADKYILTRDVSLDHD